MTDYTTKVRRVREQITTIADRISDLRQGVAPKTAALAEVELHIAHEASKVTIRADAFVAPGGEEAVSVYPESAHAVFCRFFPDQVRKVLREEVDTFYADRPAIADDKAKEKLEDELLALERTEEGLIREAAAAGQHIARRKNVSPAVLLED